jgi:NAD dependent epimerase/dehydratase family enzyme
VNEKTNRNDYNSLSAEDIKNVQYVKWDGKTTGEWIKELNAADIVINLAGKSVNCRYNEKNKKEIFDSRTDAVNAIGEAINTCDRPPSLWINASSATIIATQWTGHRMNIPANFMMTSPYRFANAGKKLFMINKLHKREKLH